MTKSSERTKAKLADTLRELLSEKDFSKITISDISSRAGINRKTFYYHFRSVEALMAWMIENEAVYAISDVNLESNLVESLNFVLDYLEANRELFKSINHSVGRGAVHKFIYHNLYPIILSTIDQFDVNRAISSDEGFKSFIGEFYTEAVAGVLQNWIEKPILRDRREVTEYTLKLVDDARRRLR